MKDAALEIKGMKSPFAFDIEFDKAVDDTGVRKVIDKALYRLVELGYNPYMVEAVLVAEVTNAAAECRLINASKYARDKSRGH